MDKYFERIVNFWLRFSAIYLPFLRTRKVFSGEVTFECNFKNSEELKQKFHITNNEFYNHLPVLFTEKMVTVDNGLQLLCIKKSGVKTTWQRTGEYEWESGCIKTWNTTGGFAQSGGIWVIEAIFPRTWAALWLLHCDYFVPEIHKNHIIPEVDIAECNNGKIDNVLHFGYDFEKYSTDGRINRICKPDGKLHQYAVEILPKGYNYYLDGYLVTRFRSNNPAFVSNEKKYLVINNAVGGKVEENSVFTIKKVTVYK